MIAAVELRAGDRVVISGAAGKVRASVVRVFTREDTPRPTEAPTLRNLALTLLELAGVDRAALVMAWSTPMFVVLIDGGWFDAQRNPVMITVVDKHAA